MQVPVGYKFEAICSLGESIQIQGYEILSSSQHTLWMERDRDTMRKIASISNGLSGNISVNLSTESIIKMPESVMVQATRVLPGMVVEWVESRSSDENVKKASLTLARWRNDLGIRIALDDMGKGQDCFERFLKVKPDFAKMDGTLLHGARHDRTYRNALKVLCDWCLAEGVPTIIEWIETPEDMHIAIDSGAVMGQGYFFDQFDQRSLRKMKA